MLMFSDEDKEGTEDGFYKHINPYGVEGRKRQWNNGLW